MLLLNSGGVTNRRDTSCNSLWHKYMSEFTMDHFLTNFSSIADTRGSQNQNMSSKSKCWQHFDRTPDGGKCRLCNKIVVSKGGKTTNLFMLLRCTHNMELVPHKSVAGEWTNERCYLSTAIRWHTFTIFFLIKVSFSPDGKIFRGCRSLYVSVKHCLKLNIWTALVLVKRDLRPDLSTTHNNSMTTIQLSWSCGNLPMGCADGKSIAWFDRFKCCTTLNVHLIE